MQIVERSRWTHVLLSGTWFLILILLSGLAEMLVGGTSPAWAADHLAATGEQDCTSSHLSPSFGSTVVIDSNENICSDITSFGGRVVVRGIVNGNVIGFGSDILIAGTVNGGISTYSGNITLQDGAHVYGDLHPCGGHWFNAPHTVLHGAVLDCPKSVFAFFMSDEGLGARFWSVLTWVILGLVFISLLPEHVMLVRTTATTKMQRSFVLGLLSLLLAPAVLAVLIALIISIPLAILVVVGLVAAWALGTVAVGWQVGDAIMRHVAPQQNTRSLQIIVGLTVLILVGSLPLIGWLITLGTGLVGLGAVFLSRFGTRLYSQPKQPLPL